MKTVEEVISEISKVKHPAIDYPLIDLGIVKDVILEDEAAHVTFAFPFPNIPIADQLLNSIAIPVNHLGLKFKHKIVLMTDEERDKFMRMESEAWIG